MKMQVFYIKRSSDKAYAISYRDGYNKGYFFRIAWFDAGIVTILRCETKLNHNRNIIEIALEDNISEADMQSQYINVKWHSMRDKLVAYVDLAFMAKLYEAVACDEIASPRIQRGVGPIFYDLFDRVKYG